MATVEAVQGTDGRELLRVRCTMELLGLTQTLLEDASAGDFICGPLFGAAGVQWRVKLFLRSARDSSSHLSLFLQLVSCSPCNASIFVKEFTLSAAGVEKQFSDHTFSNSLGKPGSSSFSATGHSYYLEDWGWADHVSREEALKAIAQDGGALVIHASVLFMPPPAGAGPPLRFRLQLGAAPESPREPPAVSSAAAPQPAPAEQQGVLVDSPSPMQAASTQGQQEQQQPAGALSSPRCSPRRILKKARRAASARSGGGDSSQQPTAAAAAVAGGAASSSALTTAAPPPDVVLVAEDGKHLFPIDSAALRRHSPVFAALLSVPWQQARQGTNGASLAADYCKGGNCSASAAAAGGGTSSPSASAPGSSCWSSPFSAAAAAAAGGSRRGGGGGGILSLASPAPTPPRTISVPAEICAAAMQKLVDYMKTGLPPQTVTAEEVRPHISPPSMRRCTALPGPPAASARLTTTEQQQTSLCSRFCTPSRFLLLLLVPSFIPLQAQHLYNAADHFGVTPLALHCQRALADSLSPETAMHALLLASALGADALKQEALAFAARADNAPAVLRSDGWADLLESGRFEELAEDLFITAATGAPPPAIRGPAATAETAPGSAGLLLRRAARRRAREEGLVAAAAPPEEEQQQEEEGPLTPKQEAEAKQQKAARAPRGGVKQQQQATASSPPGAERLLEQQEEEGGDTVRVTAATVRSNSEGADASRFRTR